MVALQVNIERCTGEVLPGEKESNLLTPINPTLPLVTWRGSRKPPTGE